MKGRWLMAKKKPAVKKVNPVAKALGNPMNRPQTVHARKGKGAYRRKDKHPGRSFGGESRGPYGGQQGKP